MKHSRYEAKPLEAALKEAFGEWDTLFGLRYSDQSPRLKVAVTATTSSGRRAVILSNYNIRQIGPKKYTRYGPDDPSGEIFVWEALVQPAVRCWMFVLTMNPAVEALLRHQGISNHFHSKVQCVPSKIT